MEKALSRTAGSRVVGIRSFAGSRGLLPDGLFSETR
jgi:hypothetical protein